MVFFVSCKVNTSNPGKIPRKNIAIGLSGGFTGMNEKLIYLKNGQVFKSEQMPGEIAKISYVKQIPKKQVREMFSTMNKIKFTQKIFPEPGNINMYIERNRSIREDKHYQWNGELDSTDANFILIQKLLNFNY